ncbi:MAG TPA: response regulator [Terracidiphilus sp.]|nr:response regulator [Terracidiphilus sp.]
MVADDDQSVLETVSLLLKQNGYQVRKATDGFEALLRLESEVPDVLLTDLNMPAMSGFELLSVVRRRFPQVITIATSGAYSSSSVPPGVIADAFYAKGREDAQNLLEIVRKAIAQGPIEHDKKTAPVWIPRNGKDHNGIPFVVLTCTDCLRSFPFTVKHEPTAEVLHTPCIYCPHEVSYIIDFSRSVNSPQRRAEWKATFLDKPSSTKPKKAQGTSDAQQPSPRENPPKYGI